jgi:hypothetical protein
MRAEQHDEAKEAIELLQARNRSHSPVYINALGLPVWLFYTTDWSAPDRQRIATFIAWNQRGGPAFENAPSRGRAVMRGEGAALVVRRVGQELLGLPTGMQLRSKLGIVQTAPDSGWAQNEVWRLERTGHRDVWLFFNYAVDHSQEYLRRQLTVSGATLVDSIARVGVRAYCYDFQKAGTARGNDHECACAMRARD